MLHNLAAPAAATIVSVATGLNNGDISNLKVSPNFTFFPFMQLVSDMVGGLWALSLYIAVGAWICAAIAWIAAPCDPFRSDAAVFRHGVHLVCPGDDDPGQRHGDREVLRDAGAVLTAPA